LVISPSVKCGESLILLFTSTSFIIYFVITKKLLDETAKRENGTTAGEYWNLMD
jgi:hypothetical protein